MFWRSSEGESREPARCARRHHGASNHGKFDSVSGGATEVVLRARSSNVQAISLNVTTSGESNPTGGGANDMLLFPGASVYGIMDSPTANANVRVLEAGA